MVTITELDDDGNEIPSTRTSSAEEHSPLWVIFTLFAAVMIDAIGALSFTIPFIGEFADVIWAPISAILIYRLFDKSIIMSSLGFLEEILPMTDIIPTATLAWLRVNWGIVQPAIAEGFEQAKPIVLEAFHVYRQAQQQAQQTQKQQQTDSNNKGHRD